MRNARVIAACALCALLFFLSLGFSVCIFWEGADSLRGVPSSHTLDVAFHECGCSVLPSAPASASFLSSQRFAARFVHCLALVLALFSCVLRLAFTHLPLPAHMKTIYTTGNFVAHPHHAPPFLF